MLNAFLLQISVDKGGPAGALHPGASDRPCGCHLLLARQDYTPHPPPPTPLSHHLFSHQSLVSSVVDPEPDPDPYQFADDKLTLSTFLRVLAFMELEARVLPLSPYTFLLLLSCCVNKLRNFQMPPNLPAVKLAMGSRNPYPKEELTARLACLSYLIHFFSCCSVLSIICKMPKCRVIFLQ